MAEKEEKVRYRVTGQCFVGGNFVDPKGRTDVYVYDAPGLAGPSLVLAPEAAPAAPQGGAPLPDVPGHTFAVLERQLAAEREKVAAAAVNAATADAAIHALTMERDELLQKLAVADELIASSVAKIEDIEKQLAAAQAAAAAKNGAKK